MAATPTPITFLQDDSTHALRNPLQDVIPPYKKPKHKKNATTEVEKAAIEERHSALQDDFASFFENQKKAIEDIVEKHHKKPEYVRRILTSAPRAEGMRAPSLYNALVHYKGKELNEGELSVHLERQETHGYVQVVLLVTVSSCQKFRKRSRRIRTCKT